MKLPLTRRALISVILAGTTCLTALPSIANAKEELNVVLFSMPYTKGLAKLEADFEAKTGIKANIEVVGQNVFENRITLSFAGRTGDVDVVHTPVIQVQRWVKAGWLQPITENVDKMPTKEDILKGPLDSYLVVAPGQGFNMFVFPMVMRAYGGSFFKDYPTDLTPNMNTPEALEGLKVYSDLMNKYGPKGIGNFNFGEVAASIQSGKVAMIVDGTSIIAQAVDPTKSKFADEIDIALVPKGPDGRSPAIAVHGLGVPADAENPEASFKFIEWATSKEVLTKIALSEAYPDFTRTSVSKNEDVIKKYSSIHPKFLDLRVQSLNEAIGHYRPLLPQWSDIGLAVGENINAAVNGIISNETALKVADAEIKAILEDN